MEQNGILAAPGASVENMSDVDSEEDELRMLEATMMM